MRSANTGEPQGVPPLLVVDLSKGRAGALCAKLLGMGGANVIKLGDEEFPGFEGSTGVVHESLLHEYCNAYKVGAVVASEGSERAAVMRGAVAGADVVVTSMEGGLSHLGIGEGEVRRMNPSVIHASVSPFGTTGPYATWKSSSLLDWAASGYLFITGDPDREPLAGPEGICEAVCAYTVAMAIEAALAARRNTGRGCYIDASVMEAMVCSHQSTFSRYAAGVVMGRSGNEVATCYPLGVKRCRDGHILISVVTDQDFDRLAIAMGLPHLVADPRFSDGVWPRRHTGVLGEMAGIAAGPDRTRCHAGGHRNTRTARRPRLGPPRRTTVRISPPDLCRRHPDRHQQDGRAPDRRGKGAPADLLGVRVPMVRLPDGRGSHERVA